MFDVAESLRDRLDGASRDLHDAQTALARAQARGGAAQSALAQTAQCAIFTEALLASIKARFGELKTVSGGRNG